jgi:hypothetical protein
LKDYSYICLCLHLKKNVSYLYALSLPSFTSKKFKFLIDLIFLTSLDFMIYFLFKSHHFFQWNPFLDGIQSPLVSSKLQPCLEESWPVILQALVLDAVPLNLEAKEHSKPIVENTARSLVSGYSMVELESGEFRFLWGFALLVLFQGQHITLGESKLPLTYAKAKHGEDSPIEELDPPGLNLYEIVLPVFQCLSTERFFSVGFLTMDISRELLQVMIFLCPFCLFNLCKEVRFVWASNVESIDTLSLIRFSCFNSSS